MARRSRDWNKGLAKDLRDPEFAREFLLAAIDEGISVQHALGKSNLPPAENEQRRPNGRPSQPQGQKRQWNTVAKDGKPSGDNRPRKSSGGGNRPHGGTGAPKRNNGGKPSWMQEISGAKTDRRPVRMGE